jgi:hypothetical protein
MKFFRSVSCVGGRSCDMVSLSQKQTNSPVTTVMVSRSRLGIREGKEVGNINCAGWLTCGFLGILLPPGVQLSVRFITSLLIVGQCWWNQSVKKICHCQDRGSTVAQNRTETSWADDGGLRTLVSSQHDSINLGKVPIVRHKAPEVPLYSMNPSWLDLILVLVPARLVESGNYNVDKRLIQI